jgi:hypothetical protein
MKALTEFLWAYSVHLCIVCILCTIYLITTI